MKTFYTSEREIWREWLAEYFETESEIWLVFPMKESGDKSLLYNDAVEEALCFGWIDSTIKHIDPTHRAQRFTPRKKGSPYSRPNIERLIWLEERGMLHPSVCRKSKNLMQHRHEVFAVIGCSIEGEAGCGAGIYFVPYILPLPGSQSPNLSW